MYNQFILVNYMYLGYFKLCNIDIYVMIQNVCACVRARACVYVYVCVGFAQVEEKVCRLEENRSID